jgi:hypothetical protein
MDEEEASDGTPVKYVSCPFCDGSCAKEEGWFHCCECKIHFNIVIREEQEGKCDGKEIEVKIPCPNCQGVNSLILSLGDSIKGEFQCSNCKQDWKFFAPVYVVPKKENAL